MKKIFTIISLTAFIAISSVAQAADKIATVDVAIVVQKSSAAKNVFEQAEEERNNLQDEVSKKEDELREAERELAKQRSLISKDAFEERSKEFQKKMVTAQKDLQSTGAKLQKNYELAMLKIKNKMLEIIKNHAKSEGISAVIAKSNMLYIDESADITAKIIDKLNDELNSVKLED